MRQANLGLDLTTKRTRKREFLDEMNRVVPWSELVALVLPHAPEGKRGLKWTPVSRQSGVQFKLHRCHTQLNGAAPFPRWRIRLRSVAEQANPPMPR
jgi:hypothetical protein